MPSYGLSEEPALALVGVVPLDPVNGRGEPATLLIQSERIVKVLEPGAPLPAQVESVELEGRYVLPGFWDLHTHLAMADSSAPALLVTQGVTGVRDLGGLLDEVDGLRAKIDAGDVLGPRIVRTGPTLNGAQNGSHHRVIKTPTEAREAVEALSQAGVDLLKTHNATDRETYFALLRAARDHGLEVAGHVPTTVDPVEACEAGHGSIEHIATIFEGTYIARFESELEAFLALPTWLEEDASRLVDCFAERGTLFVPTLRAYEYRAEAAQAYDNPDPGWRYVSEAGWKSWREGSQPTEMDRLERVIELRRSLVEVGQALAKRLHDAGAPIGTGTDVASPGLLPGFDLHAEIRLLGEAGFTPRSALRAATRGPGKGAGGDRLQGQLVIGAPADLVVLGGDAFESLEALDRIEGVTLRGRYLDRAELDAALAALDRGD